MKAVQSCSAKTLTMSKRTRIIDYWKLDFTFYAKHLWNLINCNKKHHKRRNGIPFLVPPKIFPLVPFHVPKYWNSFRNDVPKLPMMCSSISIVIPKGERFSYLPAGIFLQADGTLIKGRSWNTARNFSMVRGCVRILRYVISPCGFLLRYIYTVSLWTSQFALLSVFLVIVIWRITYWVRILPLAINLKQLLRIRSSEPGINSRLTGHRLQHISKRRYGYIKRPGNRY